MSRSFNGHGCHVLTSSVGRARICLACTKFSTSWHGDHLDSPCLAYDGRRSQHNLPDNINRKLDDGPNIGCGNQIAYWLAHVCEEGPRGLRWVHRYQPVHSFIDGCAWPSWPCFLFVPLRPRLYLVRRAQRSFQWLPTPSVATIALSAHPIVWLPLQTGLHRRHHEHG